MRELDRAIHCHPRHQFRMQRVTRLAANLPDTVVGLRPSRGGGVGHVDEKRRSRSVEFSYAHREVLRGRQQLAVHIELGLLPRSVPDAHGPTIGIPAQVFELVLEQQSFAANAVHDLQWVRRVDHSARRRSEESKELGGFVRAGGDPERFEGHARVADPTESIVPISTGTDRFGQRRRRGGHYRARGCIGQRLEDAAAVTERGRCRRRYSPDALVPMIAIHGASSRAVRRPFHRAADPDELPTASKVEAQNTFDHLPRW